jgi:ribonuclease R
MAAERETVDRLIAHFLADRVDAVFEGRIGGVTRAGLFVKLDDTGADGFVPISTLGSDYFVHDEARHALIGRHSGEMHRLGDEVEIRLLEVAPIAGALRFELLSEGRQAPARGGRGGDRRDSGAKKFGRGKPQSRRGEKKRGRR